MPAYYDPDRKTYYCKFRYTDYTGESRQKMKRGFKLKRDAVEWESEFLHKAAGSVEMNFGAFIDLYNADMKNRLRESTFDTKTFIINGKIRPYFENRRLCDIKPKDVRAWQTALMGYEDENGKKYSKTYLKTINNQLSALFNYAVKYYDLRENPCHKAGSMGKKNADEMLIWTADEYEQFIECCTDNPVMKMSFETLFYTGMRIGEMFALTPADIDLDAGIITVSKSLRHAGQGRDVITEPKTPKSNRVISIPPFLCDDLREYERKIYGITDTDLLFQVTKSGLSRYLERKAELAGVKRIRLHDLRHSHASLLIELGFSPVLIAERLGHEHVETTLNTYSHLYPNKQTEVCSKIQSMHDKKKS